ncbi:MAG: methylenetetrahydrofolate reductase C-terminal domain-containing protein [Rhodocyclales bacterium]|nr:methylenetetrahydrofolate reductase C-terminal domain-containing protein [Rhodocyclales bacterium]
MLALRRWSVRHARGLNALYGIAERVIALLGPLVKRIGPARVEAVLHPLERATKQLVFDCLMCGQCVLSSTGMACPTNCAKQMRNGPCGGVRDGGYCEVKPEMRCVWVEAGDGGRRIAAGGALPLAEILPALPPIDHRRSERSSWIEVMCGKPTVAPIPNFSEDDVIAHPAGSLERACHSGRFVVTVEVAPPDSADPQALLARAAKFQGLVDAINITDGAGGNCHMSSVAASAILTTHGLTPVYQVACRDRNRIAVQGDILGAAALGVQNILCLTGDDVSQGDHPEAKPVFDLDAVSLLRIARGMCDRGVYASGRKLERAPSLFIGATANPFAPPYAERILNLEKKIDAGAQFIQTQFCFDLKLLEDFMREARRRELHRRARIIVGVGTLGSAKALKWMATHVPGVHVPEPLLARIAGAADQKAEAKRACIEMIQALAGIDGVAGVHVMGHKNEDVLAEIIAEAGVGRSALPLTEATSPLEETVA